MVINIWNKKNLDIFWNLCNVIAVYKLKTHNMARPRKNPLMLNKICPTCKKTFTVSSRKYRQTFCSRTCANHHPDVIAKMIASQRNTSLEKYGVEHPMMTEEVKKNFCDAMQTKYGVDYYSQTPEHTIKSKKTKKEHFGNENFTNPKQRKKTCLERYGVDNYTKTEEYRERYVNTCLEKYGIDHASKTPEYALSHKTTMFKKFLESSRFQNFVPQFNITEYKGVTHGIVLYPFKCKRCNTIDNHDISCGKPIFCDKCDETHISLFQKEIGDFVRSLLSPTEIVEQNNRRIISPKEIDINVPSLKIAIECDGLCWHSEILGNKNKVYHLNKTKYCLSKGIFLIHIFESEWNYKKEIVKSILSRAFGKCQNKIYGRKCVIKEIDKNTCKRFLDGNHVQGNDHSTYKYGLFFEDVLVSVMTFCKSRFDKKIEYEMSRFCNKTNTMILGGASKLFKHFVNVVNPTTVVSYSDRRYFNGTLYNNLGFSFVHNSQPNYYYIIDNYQTIQHRMGWQKHKQREKLPIFDPTLSEWENMKNNGYDRIWDCGHGKWLWSKS